MAVHFTKQQIDEIEQALIARSKRDSQFPGADELDGTELIPIVQNGVNKIMTYSGLWNKVAADLQEYVEESLETKVDKVEGKELSTNDFDDDYKDKLDHIQAGAEVNVQSDWTAESGDAFILHKPDLSIYATNARVEDIEALIPNAASTSNQLADKSFVNSSIATNTAEFKGTYDTLEELMTVVANLNDYGFVRNIDSVGNVTFDRYKYTSNNTWLYEYSLNNSSFTQAQWDAINSGITAALVTKLNGIESAAQVNIIEGVQVDGSDLPITNKKVNVVLSGKVDKVAGKGLSTNDYTNSEKLKLGAFPAWSDVEASINSKVDKSGSETKDEIFTYQQTGGGLTKNVKNARVTSYKGKTLAWNQLVQNGNFADGTNGWDVIGGTISVNNNVLSYTVSTLGQTPYDSLVRRFDIPILKNHKIYISLDIKAAHTKDIYVYFITVPGTGGNASTIIPAVSTSWTKKSVIYIMPSYFEAANGGEVQIGLNTTSDNGYSIGDMDYIRSFQIIDLTLMFGAGNEPSTVEEFEAMFPLPYYEYNAGSLISNDAESLETVGFNQWDEEWEVEQARVKTKNYIPVIPGSSYYLKIGSLSSGSQFTTYLYDNNKNLVQTIYPYASNTITIPSGVSYMYMLFPQAYGATYNHDICINLSNASKNGTYEPYWKRRIELNLSTLKDKDGNLVFPYGGMHGTGTAFDLMKPEADGFIHYANRVFARVDLGSLAWQLGGNGNMYTQVNVIPSKPAISSEAKANAICEKYRIGTQNEANGVVDKTFAISSVNTLMCYDTAYTDAATFKAAMQGVMLYYELATPIEYELVEPICTDYPVDRLGTERVISDTVPTPPFRADITYHEANIKDIEVEGITDYLKKAELKKELNTELTKLEGWSPVIAAAFAKLQSEIDSLKELLNDYQLKVKAESVDVLEYKIAGMPRILYSSTAGAPSASNVPDNWDESTMNGWSGVPRFIGQLYLDKPGKKVYFAAAVTNSTNDWVVLN